MEESASESERINEWISVRKQEIPLIPHSIRPYGDGQYKLTFAGEHLVFKSIEKEIEKLKHRIFNLIDSVGNPETIEENINGSLAIGDRIRQDLSLHLIKMKMLEYVQHKIASGWKHWRIYPTSFQRCLITWCYKNKKNIKKAKKQYEDEKIVFSSDLTLGLLKKKDLSSYTKEVNGKLEKIELVKEGTFYRDLAGRFRWSAQKVETVKELYQVPISYAIKLRDESETKQNEVALLTLVGKHVAVIIAPVRK